MRVRLVSFSFKRGVPAEAEMVLDARFLQNPHYLPHLMQKNGLEEEVGAYIREDEEFDPFITRVSELLKPLLPRYAARGREVFTLAVGCTGGQHRSVYVARVLAEALSELGYEAEIIHRELEAA